MIDLAARLAQGAPVTEPAALVVAHPDDEVVGLGSRLHLFQRLTLIHLTDGAPADMGDARRAGFATRPAYAAARAAELDAALAVLEVRPERRLFYGFGDQSLVDRLPELTDRLEIDLAGCAVVFTHAYEGGHPDHDAAALAVQAACARLGRDGPQRWEFAGYFGRSGALQVNRFHPDHASPETTVTLTEAERVRKAQAFAAHASQADTLSNLPPEREAWRRAPLYDFASPPAPGETHYDRYGWEIDGARWRARAAAAGL